MQLEQIKRQNKLDEVPGDNSNTQFAALALWIGRRHGLPVEHALALLDAGTRACQAPNGGFPYTRWSFRGGQGPMVTINAEAAMTCSGLMCLAITAGAVNERVLGKNPKAKRGLINPNKDASIRGGFDALSVCIGEPIADSGRQPVNLGLHAFGKGYYFLWSVERVAAVYGLQKIAKKDWYAWGAEILLANQNRDGSWKGTYGAMVDTSFALLFLCRSNLAPDLTASLRGISGGEVGLSSGGQGGSKLVLGRDIHGGIDPNARSNKNDPADKSWAATEKKIAALTKALVKGSRERQEELVKQYQKERGVEYTEALAGAIPLLKGDIKGKAQTALVGRLTRLKVQSLRDKLRDDNLEVRRAGALASARKKARVLVPDLITLLEDSELPVAIAARQSLKDLSGEDFGPEDDATRDERKAAVAKWLSWWKERGNG
jgi:hypothetical protein